ncbi:MAG: alpha/beta fold hydrolase [Deltaproteobacteria bacterium]|nr:MAG: alpha/beta fold hydrolase [Deltaproteobacteria bacterium]
MPRATAGEVELEYDTRGDGDPVLMIMGIGAQMILWPPELLDGLAARGLQVIRFDNRDVGRSTWLDHLGRPDIGRLLPRAWLGLPVSAPYTLSHMAADAVGLLDHLGIARAHVVGVSMGGMIAQHVAIEHPARVRSLTTMMSTTGGRRVSLPRPRALRALLTAPARTVDEAEEAMVRFMREVNGPAFDIAEDRIRAVARESWLRGVNPDGFVRQFAAILASGDRTARLRQLDVPTLVLHGTADPLVPVRGGKATARAIRGARLRLIDGWGHGLPPGVVPLLVDEIGAHIDRHRGGPRRPGGHPTVRSPPGLHSSGG